MTEQPSLLVIHEQGAPAGGAAWRDPAVGELLSGWTIHAPDLPGHGTAELPAGGNYDPSSPGYGALRTIVGESIAPTAIVGVGGSGWAAQTLALAGHGERLVLVDGLGDPWRTPAEAVAERQERLRRLVRDPTAMADWSPSDRHPSLDPRLGHTSTRHGSHGLAMRAAKLTSCPVLIVHASDHDQASLQVINEFPSATVMRCSTTRAADVAGLLAEWLGA